MRFIAIAIIAITSILGGCASNPYVSQRGTSTGYEMGQQRQAVQLGTVLSVRDVQMVNQPSVLGERTGATLAGLVGFALSKEMTKNLAAQVAVGALSGSVGMEVGRQMTGTVSGQEMVIKADSGEVFSIAQSSADGARFTSGQRVMMVGGGRVAPAY